MIDFLTHLAARSFSPQPTLRPKVLSIFEPVNMVAAVPSAEMLSGEVSEVATPSAPTSSEMTDGPQGRRPGRPKPATSKADQPPQSSPPQQTELQIRDGLKSSRSGWQALQPETEPDYVAYPLKLHTASRPKVPEELQLPAILGAPQVGNDLRFRGEASATLMNPTTPSRPADRVSNTEERMSEKHAPPEGDSSMKQRQAALLGLSRSARNSASLSDALTPSRLRSKSEARETSEARQEVPAERSIHISIGRIDVIAEAASTLARPIPREAQSGISLEDYLRQKKVGGMG